jgi:hypothetical protein
LVIIPDARGRSLGEGGSVFSRGAISAYYNPALLVTSEIFSAEYNYYQYLPELADDLVAKNFYLSSNYKDLIYYGMGYFKFSYGRQERTDEFGYSLGTYEPHDKYLGFWAATVFDDNNSAGIGMKYVKSFWGYYGSGSERIEDETIALDFGFLSRNHLPEITWLHDRTYYPNLRRLFLPERPKGLSLGLSVTNLGEGINFSDLDEADPLPRKLRIGTGYQAIDSEPVGLQFTIDATKILVDESDIAWSYALEAEFYYLAVFRIGRYYDYDSRHRYTTIGFGIGPDWLRFDYARIPGEYDYDWNRKAGEYSISLRCNIAPDLFKNM